MQREIKFRVWFETEKLLIYPHRSFPIYIDNEDWVEGQIPMQYTGIKDKNSKEIYEGDIVEFFSRDGMRIPVEMTERHVITWRSGDVDTCHGFQLPWNFYGTLKWSDKSTIEVIGNIYENSELLNENANH